MRRSPPRPASTSRRRCRNRRWREPPERIRRSAVAEREVKLAAPPSFRLPDLNDALDGAVAEPRDAIVQQTVYHDTGDLRLARWGCSLRYRDVEGWTVTLPSSGTGPMLVR